MKEQMSRKDFLKLGGITGVSMATAGLFSAGSITGTVKAEEADEEVTIKEVLGSVNSANIVVYDPGTADSRSKICIVMMYGSSRLTDALPNENMKRFAAMGYRAANCAPAMDSLLIRFST